METRISFATDSDRFLTQECPACSGRFRIKLGEGTDQPVSFCPYCAHHGQECWWTPEQAHYIGEFAKKLAADEMSSELEKMARRVNSRSSSGFLKVKMTTKRTHSLSPTPPPELAYEMPLFEFLCCGERIKYNAGEKRLFCIICGKETPL